MDKRRFYIVEVKLKNGNWEPTEGGHYTQRGGRKDLAWWRENKCGEFRLTVYTPKEDK